MSHIDGQQDRDLHNADGSHRSTAPSADGQVVAQYERRITAHMQMHEADSRQRDQRQVNYTSPDIMSPQARRRLNSSLHGREIMDLAAEIADGLERAAPDGIVVGEEERMVILAVLVKSFGDCDNCKRKRVKLVARLDGIGDSQYRLRNLRVCETCHADPRIPTTYFTV